MADKGLDIVDKYNLEVVQVSRGRGAQVLHTADGLYILKEYKGRGSYINDEAVMLDALMHPDSSVWTLIFPIRRAYT